MVVLWHITIFSYAQIDFGTLPLYYLLDRGPGRVLFDFPALRNRPMIQGA